MAVGDLVIQVGALSGAIDFRPASGVTVMITSFSCGSITNWLSYNNGTDTTGYISQSSNEDSGTHNKKIFCNNTIWIKVFTPSGGQRSSFSGIVVQ